MPTNLPPHVLAFAGPNGAGKSTTAGIILPHYAVVEDFVNADTIARGLSAFNPEGMAIQAGKIMLERLHELAERDATFAFETTLSGKTYLPWLKTLRSKGYRFHLMYMWLRSADIAVRRVAERVRKGGHNIPEETIRRRYSASVSNFFDRFRPIADFWRLYDNSLDTGPTLIATGSGSLETVLQPEIWEEVKRSAGHANA